MTLTASPELDLRVAVACGFGDAHIGQPQTAETVGRLHSNLGQCLIDGRIGPFRPSTCLDDAFDAAEKMNFVNFRLEKCSLKRDLRTYIVLAVVRAYDGHEILGQEDTPALALCAAILKLAEKK